MARIIALTNQKGGVGKTTTVINLGAGLACLGARVLLVDMDPQGSLTYSCGYAAHKLEKTVYQVLQHPGQTQTALLKVKENVQLLPSNLSLAAVEQEFSAIVGRELLLKERLTETDAYDYILIDCPPSMGLLTLNALAAAKEVIIPLQAEYLALQGVDRLKEVIAVVKQRLNPQLVISGVIITRFDRRKSLHREVLAATAEHFGPVLLSPPVRDNIALAEAPSFGKDVFSYRPSSAGAKDYLEICRQVGR